MEYLIGYMVGAMRRSLFTCFILLGSAHPSEHSLQIAIFVILDMLELSYRFQTLNSNLKTKMY